MKKIKIFSLIMLLSLSLWVGACSKSTTQAPPPAAPEQPKPVATQEVNLYFSDDQAMYLVAEKRSIQAEAADQKQLAASVVNELIAGPKQAKLYATMPQGSKLLSLEIAGGLATVNLNQDFQSKHSGGSTGEMMTIYSLVNSLTDLQGIQQVQLLVEGKKLETLKGHLEISEPLTRNPDIIKK
ncbi:MAG: GerMN domain-containing protein [Syntrophomonas sp.]